MAACFVLFFMELGNKKHPNLARLAKLSGIDQLIFFNGKKILPLHF